MDYSLWGHKELDTAERLSLSLGIKPMFLGPHPRWQKSHSGVIRWEPRKHHKSQISIKNVFLPLIHQESSLSLDLQLSLSLKSWDLAQMSSKASSEVTFFEAWSSVPCIVWVIWTGPPCPARSLMEGIHAAYANVDTPICPQSIKEWKKCLNWVFCLKKKKLLIFNWRIVSLQYCIGFCHTSAWISYRYMFILNRSCSSLGYQSFPSWTWEQVSKSLL